MNKNLEKLTGKHICCIVLLLSMVLCVSSVKAQFYTTGENPAGVRWRYIKSGNYKIIYPDELDSLAQRYAWLLEKERGKIMAGLKINPKQIPVILNPYTSLSNGTAIWAPKRVELYTQPRANGGYAQNWERQLVLHESRHIGQMSYFTKGIFKPLTWILGEQITGAAIGVYASKWLLEGDAVIAETELSNSGRGRSASFLEYYRASFLQGEYRSWEKWRYGSFKYHYPDHYAFGYLLNSTMRVKSGNYLAAGDLFETHVKQFYNPDVHSSAMKGVVGVKQKELLTESINMYTEMWRGDYEKRGEFTQPVEIAHKKSRYYYEYSNPIEVGKDSLVWVKNSNDNLTELVMSSTNERFLQQHKQGERLLKVISPSTDGLEIKDKTIYWIESVPDARWGKRVYNDLYSYNIETGKTKRLSNGKSYNNPVLSSCGEYLSVMEYPVTGGSNLVILNAVNGEREFSIAAPDGGQLTESSWIGDAVYVLAITEQGLGMFCIDLEEALLQVRNRKPVVLDKDWEQVIKEQNKNISGLGSDGEWLYFESDMNGVNNIYFFNPETEELQRRTNAEFAAHDPYYSNGRLYYTDLQLGGRLPVYTQDKTVYKDDNEMFVQNGEIENSYDFTVAETLSKQANDYFAATGIFDNDTLQGSFYKYESKPYRKGAHLFHFHSWAPIYYNVNRIMSMSYDHFYDVASLGATAYSQNQLGTAVTMLGYSFREGHHAGHVSFEYSGLYPVFEIKADYNASDRYKYRVVTGEDDKKEVAVSSNGVPLFELSALAYVPINLSSNGWQRGLVPQVEWMYDNNAFYSTKNNSYVNRQQIAYTLQYYQMQSVADARIYPKWGVGAVVKGAFSPNGHENFGHMASGYTYFYMPGVWNCQGIRLSAAYQKYFADGKLFYLDNLAEMPRGYDDYYGNEYYKFSVDYAIPINLKGLSLEWLAYLKRLQVIPFADIAGIKGNNGKWQSLNSYGCDLLLDGIFCHIGVPISFGIRYARTNENKNHIGILAEMSLF